MTKDHFTGLRVLPEHQATAWCLEHGQVGLIQPDTRQGRNAVMTEARAHDSEVHGIYRRESAWVTVFNNRLIEAADRHE